MIALHTILAVLALAVGPVVLFGGKGGRGHRRLGYLFAVALLGVDLSAFAIYEVSGRPTMIHALAIVNLATLAAGVRAALQGRIAAHQSHMAYAYAGLIAALTVRLQGFLPGPPSWLPSWLTWTLLGAGGMLAARWTIARLLLLRHRNDGLGALLRSGRSPDPVENGSRIEAPTRGLGARKR